MATKKAKKQPKRAVGLRPLLKAIRTRRAKGGRVTQADYAVALDKIVRAISRRHPGAAVIVRDVRVL